VKDLSPRQRAVLVLRYHEDWSEEQIAAAMGVSTGTVKKLAARGLAALREQLKKQRETAR
jgi:RNA polymerase sigma factor (sigma-70 family)